MRYGRAVEAYALPYSDLASGWSPSYAPGGLCDERERWPIA